METGVYPEHGHEKRVKWMINQWFFGGIIFPDKLILSFDHVWCTKTMGGIVLYLSSSIELCYYTCHSRIVIVMVLRSGKNSKYVFCPLCPCVFVWNLQLPHQHIVSLGPSQGRVGHQRSFICHDMAPCVGFVALGCKINLYINIYRLCIYIYNHILCINIYIYTHIIYHIYIYLYT